MASVTAAQESAPQSKSERAYRWLRDRIVGGDFPGGHRLVLDQIARELDASPVPVREALRRLEAEKLVVFTRNVGAQVAAVDSEEYAHTMQTLAVLEGAATALAAPHVDELSLAKAAKLNESMRALLDDVDPLAFSDLNHEFHEVIFAHCPNPQLLSVLQETWAHMMRIRGSIFGFIPGRPHDSVDEHDALLALIRSGAPGMDIEDAVRRHRLNTLNAYLDTSGANHADNG